MAKETDLKIKRKITSREKNEFLWGWAFILPTMIGLIVLNIYPIIKTIYESFFKTGDFGKGNIFIGLANYQRVLTDPEVWQSLLNTFKYAIVEVPFSHHHCSGSGRAAEPEDEGAGRLPYDLLPPHGCGPRGDCHGVEMAL